MAKSSVSMVQLLTSQWPDQWMVKQSSILGISLIQSINGHRLSTLLMAHLTHFIMTLLKPHSWHSRIYAHFCSVWHLHMTPMYCSNVTSQHIPAAFPKSGMLIWSKSKPCRQPEQCDTLKSVCKGKDFFIRRNPGPGVKQGKASPSGGAVRLQRGTGAGIEMGRLHTTAID